MMARNLHQQTKKSYENVIAALIVTVLMLVGLALAQLAPTARAYNKQVCMVTGYEEDCQTPLGR